MPDPRKESDTVRVLTAGLNPLLTSVWSAAIATRPEMVLIGATSTIEETLALVPHSDVVLLSVVGEVEAGVEWVRMITQAFPDSRVLVVGIPHQEHIILGYIEAGASAYVPEDETVERVLESLPAVMRGEAHVAPEVAPALIGRLARLRQVYAEPETIGTRLEALTPRERQILELIARDSSNRDIAENLLIEVGTVKNHVHSILEKLSMQSRHQAASYFQAALGRPQNNDVSSPRDRTSLGAGPEGRVAVRGGNGRSERISAPRYIRVQRPEEG
ncbi:MAG TPA: response regulator transcription factor [Anaerolineales bacterium]|nr:response regulator transcription factor [Anaerolineales bacterium]